MSEFTATLPYPSEAAATVTRPAAIAFFIAALGEVTDDGLLYAADDVSRLDYIGEQLGMNSVRDVDGAAVRDYLEARIEQIVDALEAETGDGPGRARVSTDGPDDVYDAAIILGEALNR